MGAHQDFTIAIAEDAVGRHYFISADGSRFRKVPHFPIGGGQAQALFDRQGRCERDRRELVRDFGGGISFMSLAR